MRCDASDDCVGSSESDCRTAPLGATSSLVAPATPTSAIATAIAPSALAKRSATSLVEEVQVLRVDCDRHAVADLHVDVRGERGDGVRPRADDARCVLVLELLLGGARLGLDVARGDLEVRH